MCATRNRNDLISRPVRFTIARKMWYFGAPDVTFAQSVVNSRLLVSALKEDQLDASNARTKGNY